MSLIFIFISIIEFVVIYVVVKGKIKNKFNINDYEVVVLSICRSSLSILDADNIDIDEFCEEVRVIFYNELEKENIIIDSAVDDVNIKAYIKNLIYINNLFAEVNYEKEYDEDAFDEVYNVDNRGQSTSVSMLSAMDDFYK